MNPRHRRMLIPGLLIALMVVVVIAAVVDRADAADRGDLVMSDPRITESSGLAVSRTHEQLAYTVNDSGHDAEVFAIDLRTGEVVGVTTVEATFRDVEALALRDGTLWIADLGDNRGERDDAALFAIDEPGPTTATVSARRHPVALAGGPADVEALLAEPGTDRLHVVTKSMSMATLHAVSEADLAEDRVTVLEVERGGLPAMVTDGAWSPDGETIALLSYGTIWTLDPSDWSVVDRLTHPLSQSETLAFVDDTTVLVGREGRDSPLRRVELAIASSAPTPATIATAHTSGAGVAASASDRTVLLGGAGLLAAVALGAAGLVVGRGRRRSRRRTGTRRRVR